ncbi:MAG: hypothetical protein EXR73_15065 [Myxococcales bacterium]|nr:hypothetical protein [Myxococcales bacterium]
MQGSRTTLTPDLLGLAGATNVVPFRNLVHLRAILREFQRGRRVVVIGGGHFGVEAADGLARRGTIRATRSTTCRGWRSSYWDFDDARFRSLNRFADGTLGSSYRLTDTEELRPFRQLGATD